MNEPDDPNNHVPDISPDDDWDDTGEASGQEAPALPPRRSEPAVSSRKEAGQSSVKSTESPDDPDSEPSEATQAEERPEKPAAPAKTSKKKSIPKRSAEPAEKTEEPARSEMPVATPIDEEEENQPEEVERVGIPAAQVGKRPRVHEIGRSDSGHHPGPRGMKPLPQVALAPAAADDADVEVARQRRRYVSGERGDWGEEKGREPVRWMLYSGLGVILLVILMVALRQRFGGEPARETDVSIFSQMTPMEESAQREEQADEENTEMMEMLSEGQVRARELYGRFASANSPGEITEILFNSAAVLPVMEQKWEPLGVPEGWQPADDSLWSVMESKGVRFGVLDGLKPDHTPFAAYFRNTPDGLKLDWKATTGYGTAHFGEMTRGKGDGSEIRAWLALSDFHTFALAEEEFRSFRLSDPRGEGNLWGYTRAGSELDESLLQLFTPSHITGESQREAQVVVRISPGPEDGLPNQWIIEELIRLNWLDQ